MGDGLEHLAAWRGRNPLTIRHAGSLIAGVDPHYQFPVLGKRTEAERKRFAVVTGWQERLWSAAQGKSEDPPLAATINNKVTKHTVGGSPFASEWMNPTPAREVTEKTPEPALSTVRVEDLCAWLESIGHRPAFFFPEPVETPPADKPLTTTERETLLGIIAVLAEMAGIDLREGFKKYTAADKVLPHAAARKMKASRETLANKLSEARELINPKGPVLRDPKSPVLPDPKSD